MIGPRRPVVTYVVLALCLSISVPTMIEPALYDLLGGFKPLGSGWQRLTLAFQHGFQGFPAPLHLGFNAALLLTVGSAAERILGSARFALLSAAAMAAYAVAHACPLVDGHGASGVIWAYAPVIYAARRHGRGPSGQAALLSIMWVVVPLFMTVLVYTTGYRGNPLFAFLLGNIFHVSATITGLVCVILWRERIRRRAAPDHRM